MKTLPSLSAARSAPEAGANATADFVAATNGGVNFGGTVGSISAWGVSGAIWGDPANPTGWSAPACRVLFPARRTLLMPCRPGYEALSQVKPGRHFEVA